MNPEHHDIQTTAILWLVVLASGLYLLMSGGCDCG